MEAVEFVDVDTRASGVADASEAVSPPADPVLPLATAAAWAEAADCAADVAAFVALRSAVAEATSAAVRVTPASRGDDVVEGDGSDSSPTADESSDAGRTFVS